MADGKVKCPACGAKNTDPLAERCRLCGAMLPDAARRRGLKLEATTAGPAFTDLVESEVGAWKQYEHASQSGPRSRRPTDDSSILGKLAHGLGQSAIVLVALGVGAAMVFGAWAVLIR